MTTRRVRLLSVGLSLCVALSTALPPAAAVQQLDAALRQTRASSSPVALEIARVGVDERLAADFPALADDLTGAVTGYAEHLRRSDRPVVVIITADMAEATAVDLPVIIDRIYDGLAAQLGADRRAVQQRLQFWYHDPSAENYDEALDRLTALNHNILVGPGDQLPASLQRSEWIGARHFSGIIAGDLGRALPRVPTDAEGLLGALGDPGVPDSATADWARSLRRLAPDATRHVILRGPYGLPAFIHTLAEDAGTDAIQALEILAFRQPLSRQAQHGALRALGRLMPGRYAGLDEALRALQDFDVQAEELEHVARAFERHMTAGIQGRPSSLGMNRTYLGMPTGQETGEYLALDIGGSNGRGFRVDLRGQGNAEIIDVARLRWEDHADVLSGGAEAFFDRIVQQLVAPIATDGGRQYSLGFSFAFPLHQTALDSATLIKWTKDDFKVEGIVGQDVARLLQDALDRNGLSNVRVRAVMNDTLGPLLTGAYRDHRTDTSLIHGTGENTARYDPLRDEIINEEAGGFVDDALRRTPADRAADSVSEKPGEQVLEKMTSGKYLGEVLRAALAKLAEDGRLFKGQPLPAALRNHNALTTEDFMSPLELEAERRDLPGLQQWISQALGVAVSESDAALILAASQAISTRAARLIAVQLVATVRYHDPGLEHEHVVAVDGSVFERYPHMADRIREAIGLLAGDRADRIHIELIKDSTGIGAAIAAAMAEAEARARAAATPPAEPAVSSGDQPADPSAPPAREAARSMTALERLLAGIPAAGLLAPIEQIRSVDPEMGDWGSGNFYTLMRMNELHARLGMLFTQILPPFESVYGYSPYKTLSKRVLAFRHISVPWILRELRALGFDSPHAKDFIRANQSEIQRLNHTDDAEHGQVESLTLAALREIWRDVQAQADAPLQAEFEQFRNSDPALEEDLLYLVVKEDLLERERQRGGDWNRLRDWSWTRWNRRDIPDLPEGLDGLDRRDPQAMQRARQLYAGELRFRQFAQFWAYRQYGAMLEHARQHHIDIVIDTPIDPDEVTVWRHPDLFESATERGVPPEFAYRGGQRWQFAIWRLSLRRAREVFLDEYKAASRWGTINRADHGLGYLRTLQWVKDAQRKLTWERQGLYDSLRALQERGRSGDDAAKQAAAEAATRLTYDHFRAMRHLLPEDLRDTIPANGLSLLFDDNGELTPHSIVEVIRPIPFAQGSEPHAWGTPYRNTTQAVVNDQPFEVSLRLNANKEAGDNGFMWQYLFGEGSGDVQPTDSLRMAYFQLEPGEALISEMERILQEQGKVGIWENLGLTNFESETTERRLALFAYLAMAWSEVPYWGKKEEGGIYNQFWPEHHVANAYVAGTVPDSPLMTGRWGGEISYEHKVAWLERWVGRRGDDWNEEDARSFTPRVQRAWLSLMFAGTPLTREAGQAPLMVAPMWSDVLNLPPERRLNIPGRAEGQWIHRFPRAAAVEFLLAALDEAETTDVARTAIVLLGDLMQELDQRMPDLGLLEPGTVAGMTPRPAAMQDRVEDQPFMLDAMVRNPVESVTAEIRDESGQVIDSVPLTRLDAAQPSASGEILSHWTARWPWRRGRFSVRYVTDTGARSAAGGLWGIGADVDANSMSPDFGRPVQPTAVLIPREPSQVIVLGHQTTTGESLNRLHEAGYTTSVGAAIPDQDLASAAVYSGGVALVAGLQAGLGAAGGTPEPPQGTAPAPEDPWLFLVEDARVSEDTADFYLSLQGSAIAG